MNLEKQMIKVLKKKEAELNKYEVSVGVVGDEKMITIALTNEFGSYTKNISSRPFARNSFKGVYYKELEEVIKNELKKYDNEDFNVDVFFNKIGLKLQTNMRNSLIKNTYKENKEPYRSRKLKRFGDDKPLIATGELLKSINYEVKKK